jgi:hypothetical protein
LIAVCIKLPGGSLANKPVLFIGLVLLFYLLKKILIKAQKNKIGFL